MNVAQKMSRRVDSYRAKGSLSLAAGSMKRPQSSRRCDIGELVNAAYEQAKRFTSNRRVAALIVSQTLEACLAKSDRPELVDVLADAAA